MPDSVGELDWLVDGVISDSVCVIMTTSSVLLGIAQGLVHGAGGTNPVPLIASEVLLNCTGMGMWRVTVLREVIVLVIRFVLVVVNAVASGSSQGRNGPAPPSGLQSEVLAAGTSVAV